VTTPLKHSCGGELHPTARRGRYVCSGCGLPVQLGDRGGAREELDLSSSATLGAETYKAQNGLDATNPLANRLGLGKTQKLG